MAAASSAASSAVIEAPVAVVWEVLHDVESFREWQTDLRRVECLERDGDGRPGLVRLVLDTVIRQTEVTLRVTYAEPHVMRWEKHSGDVPGFVGSWNLVALGPERTSAEYRLTIDFGRLGRLVRGPLGAAVNGAAQSSMPGKLKSYVEGRLGHAS